MPSAAEAALRSSARGRGRPSNRGSYGGRVNLGLEGRVCVVTGSTAGIGLETARLLAAERASVVVSGLNAETVERARKETGAALGIARDLSQADAPAALVAEAERAFGRVDCLVNNVGVA